ncbi:Phage-related protein [Pseudomonas sp. OF001]|uniref:hypothetical protein n=1 Tax=Pseudomonas sp. OF001 TaxID=2772300 RepID=UPI00191A4C65|nr:hypothetical protein [Pseudomonas sp. OF001]CAD5377109.1 Phage-related protein [Pseudomonas sp. OF001]
MKERPILFSGPMVRAILDGRKTVTRRAIKHQPDVPVTDAIPRRNYPHGPATADWYWRPKHGHLNGAPSKGWDFKCPYGEPGDRLWVRESHAQVFEVDIPEGRPVGPIGTAGSPGRPDWKFRYVYRADGEMPNVQWHHIGDSQPVRWTPSIRMPRTASRILLEITDVRVERLQDGDGETAFGSRYLAEGINRIHHGDGEYYYHAFESEPGPGNWIDPFDAWRELWESINGAEPWDANPWVWVVEFKRVTP